MKQALSILFGVLFIDQFVKIWIKTHMLIGEEISVLGSADTSGPAWFTLHFTENNGMAFGMELAGDYGKLILSVFRILAVCGICWYLYSLIKKQAPTGLIVSISLILAGALGNIIDSAFYGMLFNESPDVSCLHFTALDPEQSCSPASIFPAGGGYEGFLYGKVVDMLYFPLIDGHFPGWFPFWGGESFQFFRPVFNIADSSISVGVGLIVLFQKRFFPPKEMEKEV